MGVHRRVFLFAGILYLGPLHAGGGTLDTIAFGSCLRQHEPQPVWYAIAAARPDLFLFIGDNVYADTFKPEELRAAYRVLAAQPGFNHLRAQCPIRATWDDHDYGWNDMGADYPLREVSKEIFLEFFRFPESSPVRRRPGIYDAQMYGPPGRRVQVILLDTRYFRGQLKRGVTDQDCPRIRYLPNEDATATLLGEAQWLWLEQQLRRPARLRVVASSIQVIPEEHCFEKWANLPHERQRLFRLLGATRANGVVLISGDRHLAEISRIALDDVGYPIYEVTSSGMNSAGAGLGERNRYRTTPDNFRQDNFGRITIDWDRPGVPVALEILDASGSVVIREAINLDDLDAFHVLSRNVVREE